MVERASGVPAAILVGLQVGATRDASGLDELKLLAASAGLRPCACVQGRRDRPDPAMFAGAGKVEEIRSLASEHGADVVIFDHELSAVQERNLERELALPVVDRTRLILEIFSRRARSHEGKLQVELARLEHLSTRLVRGWTHLERQRGARGKLGGMGEKQLEVDRRLLGQRVKLLRDRLARARRQREVQRRARTRGEVLSVSLVGYTNAGKSTLFNAMTRAGAYAADKLFATLDTTTRKLFLPGAGAMVISDTVGFIRELPHTLVAAFRATLEETVRADLLLHVVDASSDTRDAQIKQVNAVLAEIGAAQIAQILVWNKTDLTGGEPAIDRDEYGKISRVRLSARTGAGIELLRLALTEFATARREVSGHSDAHQPNEAKVCP